jgi:FkbM family methyltransferase
MRGLRFGRWLRVGLFAGSVAIVLAAALQPWVEVPRNHRVQEPYDEFIAILVVVAAIALIAFYLARVNIVVAVTTLAGLLAAAILAQAVHDPLGPFGGPGPNIHLDWYIWLSVAAGIGIVVASVMLLVSGGGAVAAAIRDRRRARFMVNAAPMTPLVAAGGEEFVVLVPTGDKAASRRFAKSDWKETRHLSRGLDVLAATGADRERDVFVDVGAHVGTTTVPAVTRFGFRSAVALEPETTNFRLLEATIALNALGERIVPLNVAVSNTVGTAALRLKSSSGGHRIMKSPKPGAQTVPVPVTTLDALVAEGVLDPTRVSMLWLDIEGHEPQALAGASSLVERSVPVVVEYHFGRLAEGARLSELVEILRGHYTHAVDLRHEDAAKRVLPIERLAEITPGSAGKRTANMTDVLIFRAG